MLRELLSPHRAAEMEAKLRLKKRIEEHRADDDASDDDQEMTLELKVRRVCEPAAPAT